MTTRDPQLESTLGVILTVVQPYLFLIFPLVSTMSQSELRSNRDQLFQKDASRGQGLQVDGGEGAQHQQRRGQVNLGGYS